MTVENEVSFEQEMAAAYGKGADESAAGSPAESAEEQTDAGAVTGTEKADGEEEPAEESAPEAEPEKAEPDKGQSHEENARFKAMRLKAEEEAGKKMAAALAKEVDGFYRQQYAGKVNPLTGGEIMGKADALAYEQEAAKAGQSAQAEKLRGELIDLGMSEEAAAALTAPLRAGQASEETRQAQSAREQAELAEFSRKIDSEIEQLNKRYPQCGIKGPADIGADEALLAEIGQRADKNLVKAWETLHYDELIEKERAAARQTAINQARGGGHVKMAGSQRGGAVDVNIPPEEMAVWKRMGFTEEEAVKHYLGK